MSDMTHNATDAASHTIAVTEDMAGKRVDRALADHIPGYSRTRAQEALKRGMVEVDGRRAKASQVLLAGQRLTLLETPDTAPPLDERRPLPESGGPPLDIIFEDADLLVVNKPAGMVVHPAPGHLTGTLVNALLAHAPGLATGDQPSRPGIVHRLDKDTSGLLIVAKRPEAHLGLARQMKDHSMVKRYLALVEGQMPVPEGVIDAPIGRDARQRQRMGLVSTQQGGRAARTRFRVLDEAQGRSLLELQLETGRTHQIRVHLAAVSHPVVGDDVYGRAQPPSPPRQFLHASHLEFAHPLSGEWLVFDAPLPQDLAEFLAAWKRIAI